MSTSFINVHEYDGEIIDKYIQIQKFTPHEKIIMFNNLKKKLSNTESVHIINIMIRDIDNMANFQLDNNIDSTDILADIIIHKFYNDIIVLLDEQLKDIYLLGMCPSGRVIRLFQLWKGIYDK